MLKNFALTVASLLVLLAALELCFRLFPDSEIQTNNEYAYRILIDLDKQRFAPVYAEISRQFRQRGIPVIDLTGTVAGHKDSELWILPVDQHPNTPTPQHPNTPTPWRMPCLHSGLRNGSTNWAPWQTRKGRATPDKTPASARRPMRR